MLVGYRFSNARQYLTEIMDCIQWRIPQLIQARKKTEVPAVMLDWDSLQQILSVYELSANVSKTEDGNFVLTMAELPLHSLGLTIESAKRELAIQLVNYIDIYMKNDRHTAPGAMNFFPYVLRVLLCDTPADVEPLIRINTRCGDFERWECR